MGCTSSTRPGSPSPGSTPPSAASPRPTTPAAWSTRPPPSPPGTPWPWATNSPRYALRWTPRRRRTPRSWPAATTWSVEIDSASAQLKRIDDLVRSGANSLDLAREKIADPAGLLAPLDPADVLDAPGRGLTAWLERIRVTAQTEWKAAVNGLDAWRRVADGTEVAARQIADANRRPLDERNELRGLLQGLSAKAASRGLAEDRKLSAAHKAAKDLLWAAPCDLAASKDAVSAFAETLDRALQRASRPTGGTDA